MPVHVPFPNQPTSQPMVKNLAQTQNPSLTSPTTVTGTGSDVIAPHETNAQAPTTFSDVFSRFECKLNHFHSAIQAHRAHTATLTTVDEDIDAAKRLVLAILTRRNMLAPISILPADILAHIFHFHASSALFYFPPLTPSWVYLTHVCRRWRQVALDDSTLWTHFSGCGNKDWIAERLSRARNAPLVIYLDGLMVQDTFSLFTPHISHTRELCLHDLSLLRSGILQEFSIQKALTLERVELSMYSPKGIEHLGGHLFFKGPFPKLRIFSISQILFPWSLVPRGRLTYLNVNLNKEDLTSQPEVSSRDALNQLVDLLVNCPSLVVLILENCLPATLSESSSRETIHLPRLLRLCLGGSSSRVTNFFKMLKLSSSTKLRLNCTPGYSGTLDQHLILPVLSAHFNDPTPTEFRSLKIILSRRGRKLDMVASTSFPILPIRFAHFIEADANIDAKLRLSLSFPRVQVEGFSNVVDMVLRRACDVLPLSKLEFLSILFPFGTPAISWGELFRHFTEVTTVQVYGRGTTGLLQALTPPQHSRGKGCKSRRGDKGSDTLEQASNNNNYYSVSAPVRPIFPKLTSLLLEILDFDDMVPGSGTLYDLVLNAVKRRKAEKTPLSTLRIKGCVISAVQAAALEKIVRDFQWDHYKGNEDEDGSDEADDNEYYDYDYDYNHFDYRAYNYGDFDHCDEYFDIFSPALWR